MAERSKATDCKSVGRKPYIGSNPILPTIQSFDAIDTDPGFSGVFVLPARLLAQPSEVVICANRTGSSDGDATFTVAVASSSSNSIRSAKGLSGAMTISQQRIA